MNKVNPVTVGLDRATIKYGEKIVLDNLSIRFDQPEITVILGANGAGKSTFLSACAGLIPLSSGRHFRLESDGSHAPITRIGYVLQKPVIFRRSVKDNIEMAIRASKESGKDRDKFLSLMQLDHLLTAPPHHLSQGERQRLVVARVLMMHPGILMFDEATNSLDRETIKILESKTRHYSKQGLPILWVTHSIEQAKRLADRIIIMEEGRIKTDQSAKKFFKK